METVIGFRAAAKILRRRVHGGFVSEATRRTLSLRYQIHDLEGMIQGIINDVWENGDDALRRLTKEYDKAEISAIEVPPAEINAAAASVDKSLLDALELAAGRVKDFHQRQREALFSGFNQMSMEQIYRPLERVGCYAPGGTAFYPSSVLMTAIPARVAGVAEVCLVTPPGKDGRVPAPTLAAAKLAGVDRVFRIGGAQAVAALAVGTKTVPKVDKICGPGSIFVTVAKRLLYGMVALDGLQGPSEVLIIADDSAKPEYIAADMMAQAEHDPLATTVLVTTSERVAKAVTDELNRVVESMSRQFVIHQSLSNMSCVAVVDCLEEAVELSNMYAPEHLLLLTADSEAVLSKIESAGCVFTGPRATVAFGDYIAGPSHVLPTSGTARFSSPLNVLDFIKIIDVVRVDDGMVKNLGPAAATIAAAEGLTAHERALRLRMDRI
ncbi:histidinol dehydrogenase [Dehalogenimonas alkenigignens]|uniref:Histidinol dehydrogenase n=1 Tax=Dehalogenimonas alkenigignens TaxID=1217799 RepID=A0A0W0GJI4_9CHLR|nr:histidinol dehydrogenase [Dehalogenimonas alkenigignens]KTB48696.1 histidinol dehydrogenase [Dehalogenimonas alkenigignens]PVV84886.1 histidinol dehydrogenase [Dehalogenimonas alkenigignens]